LEYRFPPERKAWNRTNKPKKAFQQQTAGTFAISAYGAKRKKLNGVEKKQAVSFL
jgi:hypothetical protein